MVYSIVLETFTRRNNGLSIIILPFEVCNTKTIFSATTPTYQQNINCNKNTLKADRNMKRNVYERETVDFLGLLCRLKKKT